MQSSIVIFIISWQAEKNELLKDDEDEIEEEERKKRKREEQLEKEREERLKHLSEWKVMHHRFSLVCKLFENILSFSLWAVFGCNLKVTSSNS